MLQFLFPRMVWVVIPLSLSMFLCFMMITYRIDVKKMVGAIVTYLDYIELILHKGHF